MDVSEEHFTESDIVADIYAGEISLDKEDLEEMEGMVEQFEQLHAEGNYLDGKLRICEELLIQLRIVFPFRHFLLVDRLQDLYVREEGHD